MHLKCKINDISTRQFQVHGLVAAKQAIFSALANYLTTNTKVDTSVNIHFQICYLSPREAKGRRY